MIQFITNLFMENDNVGLYEGRTGNNNRKKAI